MTREHVTEERRSLARSPIKKETEEDDRFEIDAPSDHFENSCYSTPMGPSSKTKKEPLIRRAIRKQKTISKL
jgi:hypothetical protein